MKSSASTTGPVSTSSGSAPWSEKALTGTKPNPGMGKLEVRTSMSGAARYELITGCSLAAARWADGSGVRVGT